MTLGDIEQSLQFSNTAATTMGIQHGAYFNMVRIGLTTLYRNTEK